MEEWETDWSCDVLERIAALLFSLAVLADRAAGLAAPRRRQLLGILSVAEATAHAFLIGAGAPVSHQGQDTAADALRLAARLRALALLLVFLMSRRLALAGPRRPRPGPETPAAPASRPTSLPAPDTS